jgi:hypothetical protein
MKEFTYHFIPRRVSASGLCVYYFLLNYLFFILNSVSVRDPEGVSS